jgi:hypothetical protein
MVSGRETAKTERSCSLSGMFFSAHGRESAGFLPRQRLTRTKEHSGWVEIFSPTINSIAGGSNRHSTQLTRHVGRHATN